MKILTIDENMNIVTDQGVPYIRIYNGFNINWLDFKYDHIMGMKLELSSWNISLPKSQILEKKYQRLIKIKKLIKI